jgi:hypothetical protein
VLQEFQTLKGKFFTELNEVPYSNYHYFLVIFINSNRIQSGGDKQALNQELMIAIRIHSKSRINLLIVIGRKRD